MTGAAGEDARAAAPPLISCMGEILIDFLPIEEGGRTVGFRMHPGGSLFNVAMAIARLGGRSALVSKTGTDFFGRFLRSVAEGERIDLRWLGTIDAPSTLGFVTVADGEPQFTFYGEGTADALVTSADLPEALFAETAILHVGSIALLRGTTPGAVLGACERLQGRALISLDPNLRPGLVRDEAAYRATLDRVVGLADLVKVSAVDLGWWMPGRTVLEASAELLDRGPTLVVITRGGDGLVAARRTAADMIGSIEVPTFRVPVADTVGAGDSFNGGLLARLAELAVTNREALAALPQADLEAALRFAAGVAAVNCTRPGADPPTRPQAEAFLARIATGVA
ncbi:MAG TPA: carbohydrate kinase [Candidatus Limnocylindrales bacterium]|nr:carbohydrate kinase [Candidatus Limnocylindrales bacterium]